jgi:L-lactate dehydrogenase complex protein LldG
MDLTDKQDIAYDLDRFKESAEAADAFVFTAEDAKGIASAIYSFCFEKGIAALPYDLPEGEIWRMVATHLGSHGVNLIARTDRRTLEAHGACLNVADYGVAETGTLIYFETTADEVRAGTIPATHLALLRACDIRSQADDLAFEIDLFIGKRLQSGLPCRVSFVTGPSRTADIERALTTGVHGPKTLAIFILKDGA